MLLGILLGPSVPAGIGIGMMSAREWQMGKRGQGGEKGKGGKGARRGGGKEGRGKGGKGGIQKVLFPLLPGRGNRRKFILKIG